MAQGVGINLDIEDCPYLADQPVVVIQHEGLIAESTDNETTPTVVRTGTIDSRNEAATRRDPPKPTTRRTTPSSPGLGAWENMDTLDVDKCMHMPDGLQTGEFLPSSLQEKLTDAWNCIHRFRQSTVTREDRDRVLKLILWHPQGLLHAPIRKGKDGLRQYKELASNFLLWRQRPMMELVNR
jgi:hypothetical protein